MSYIYTTLYYDTTLCYEFFKFNIMYANFSILQVCHFKNRKCFKD